MLLCVNAQSCPTLCDPMDCNTPGFPILHYLPEFAQIHVHWVSDASNHLIFCSPLLLCLQSFPASGSFPMNQLFTSSGQSIGASASATVLPMNIQGWFLLGLTGLISLQSKGLCLISSYGQIKAQTTWMIGTCLKSNWFRIPGVKQRSYHRTLFESQLLETGDLITFTVISNYKSSICSPRQIWTL